MKFFANFKTALVKLLVGALVCSFAIWGAGTQLFNRVKEDGGWVIKVSGESYFEKDLLPFVEEARRSGYDNYEAFDKGVDSLITSSLLEQESNRLDISVDDSMIVRELGKTQSFLDSKKKFDKQKFSSILRRNGINERAFINKLRSKIAGGQLADIFNTVTHIMPSELTDAMAQAIYSTRKFGLFRSPNLSTKDFKIDEDDAREYYSNHSDSFKISEERRVKYLLLKADDLVDNALDIAIKDEEVEEEYEKRKALLTEPERRDIEQVIFAGEEQALNAYRDIVQGKLTFEGIQKQNKNLLEYSDVIRDLEFANIDNEIGEEIFSMSTGEISKPMETSLGWHIFRIKKINQERAKGIEEVRDLIVKDIKASKKYDIFINKIEAIKEAGQFDIEQIGKELSLPVEEVKISRDQLYSRDILEDKIDKKAHEYPSFANIAFDLDEEGATIAPLIGLDNAYVALSIIERRDSYVPEFEDIKAEVIARYSLEVKDRKSKELTEMLHSLVQEHGPKKILSVSTAEGVYELMNGGENAVSGEKRSEKPLQSDIEILAKMIKNMQVEEISRLSQIPRDVPMPLIVEVFEGEVGQSTGVFEIGDGAYVFAYLKDIEYLDKEKLHAAKESFMPNIVKLYHSLMLKEYIELLKKTLALKVNNDVLTKIKLRHFSS